MKNNKGMGKFEVLTMIVLIMAIIAYILWYFINGSSGQKFNTMKKNAVNLSKTVSTNINSFHNTENVYLGEAINEGLIPVIKSPFSGKDCSISESKVVMEKDMPKVTLRCDDYLIDSLDVNENYDNITIYKVSDWSLNKSNEDDEEKVLYNCLVNGQEDYKEYYEESYFILLINRDYGKNYYSIDEINNSCRVVSNTFYRTKEEIK